jgi:PAS domain S-box-containing protein
MNQSTRNWNIQNINKLFSALAEAVPVAAFVIQNSRIQLANRRASFLTGYSIEELTGLEFCQIAHPSYQPSLQAWDFEIYSQEMAPENYELKLLTKQGQERWIVITPEPVYLDEEVAIIVKAHEVSRYDQVKAQFHNREIEASALHQEKRDINQVDQLLQHKFLDLLEEDSDNFQPQRFEQVIELLQTIFEATPDGMAVLVGPTLRYAYVNSAYRSLIPDSETDPIGRNFSDIWPERVGFAGQQMLVKVLETGQGVSSFRFEWEITNSSTRYFSSHLRYFRWQGYPAVLMVLWETTAVEAAHRRAEQAAFEVRRRADELTAVISAMTEIVIIYDALGNPVQANPAAVDAFGFHPAEVNRTELVERLRIIDSGGEPFKPDDLPAARALRGEPVKGVRFTFTNASGKAMIVLASASPFFSTGILAGVVAVWSDVTEREQLMEQLEWERARLSTIISNAPVAIAVADSQGRIIMLNQMAEKFYGQPISEGLDLESQGIPGFCYIDGTLYEPRDLPLVRSALDGETLINQELMLVPLDGKRQYFLVNSAPILDRKGLITGSVSIYQDITQRKEAEAENLKNATRIEVQQHLIQFRERERLLIAQDLHDGPMQELISISLMLKEVGKFISDRAVIERLSSINTSLEKLIQELRAFSSTLRPPVLIHFGLEKALRAHAENFHEKYQHLRIHMDLDRDGTLLSETVRMALFRIYQEALTNVIRHAAATETWVYFKLGENQIELSVRDNGRGFEVPSQWLEWARLGHLGLVGTQERIEAVGGKIDIISSPGMGTTLKAYIPWSSINKIAEEDFGVVN